MLHRITIYGQLVAVTVAAKQPMHVKSSLVVVKQRQKKVSSLHHPLSDPAVSGVCQNIRMSETVFAREVCACVRADPRESLHAASPTSFYRFVAQEWLKVGIATQLGEK